MKEFAKITLALIGSLALLVAGSIRCTTENEAPLAVDSGEYGPIPDVTIVEGAAQNDTLLTDKVSFSWTAERQYEYSYSLDGGAWSVWASDTSFSDLLDDGDHVLELRVRETGGSAQ
jgi:hypothetical protein